MSAQNLSQSFDDHAESARHDTRDELSTEDQASKKRKILLNQEEDGEQEEWSDSQGESKEAPKEQLPKDLPSLLAYTKKKLEECHLSQDDVDPDADAEIAFQLESLVGMAMHILSQESVKSFLSTHFENVTKDMEEDEDEWIMIPTDLVSSRVTDLEDPGKLEVMNKSAKKKMEKLGLKLMSRFDLESTDARSPNS